MQPGKQYYADDGLQVLVWPLDIMNITQVSGPGSFSHCCGHPIDVVGTSARYPIYAPCDCHRIFAYNDSTQVYQSDDPYILQREPIMFVFRLHTITPHPARPVLNKGI